MRAVVIGNSHGLDSGFVGNHLRRRGFQFTEGHREQPGDWPDLAGLDLVLLLGSEWNVYRSETAALVTAEAAYARQAVARQTPLLGICFGAQVLAHALGATVTRTPDPEIGWYTPALEPGAPRAAIGPWMEWHDDVFSVPEGFDVLATTASGPQLVASRRAVATQFHPEATETMVRDWIEHGGAEQYRSRGGNPERLLEETRTNTARSRPGAEALVDWFLDHTSR